LLFLECHTLAHLFQFDDRLFKKNEMNEKIKFQNSFLLNPPQLLLFPLLLVRLFVGDAISLRRAKKVRGAFLMKQEQNE